MSKDIIKDYGKSIRGKLLNIAKREDIFYQTVLTRYFQERLLYRISQTKYRQNFFLKGGALMYAYEKFAARPTLDIDFLGQNISNESESIAKAFSEICSVPCDVDGLTFEIDKIKAEEIAKIRNYHGIRISVPVKMDSISQVMTMDIGFGDIVTPSPIDLDYPLLLDYLPGVSILAYSLETVIAEKMHAIVDLADQNSRMKDYYDLYRILSNEKYDTEILQEAIIQTFENRHTSLDVNTMFFRDNFANNQQMQHRWEAFMKKIGKDNDVSLSHVVTFIQQQLLPYWKVYVKS